MEMPAPGEQHKVLERLVGVWEGEETLYPSPWDPDGGTAAGRYEARMGLDGFFLIVDNEQRRGGRVNYRGHGVFGWDARGQCYTMYWFDSVGLDPAGPAIGSWDGTALVFEHEHHLAHSRHTFTIAGDQFRLLLENSASGTDWRPFLEGTYHRVG